jgi:hypothetical protein
VDKQTVAREFSNVYSSSDENYEVTKFIIVGYEGIPLLAVVLSLVVKPSILFCWGGVLKG